MQKLHINPQLKVMIEVEQRTLNLVKHENVIRLLDVIHTNKEIDLVYEYCEQGSLAKVLKRNSFSEPDALKVLFDVSNALAALKAHRVVHRDIKPENILLKKGKVKLADFGLCMIGDPTLEDTITHIGSFAFMAPESLSNFHYDFKSDVYSLGLVMYTTLTQFRTSVRQTTLLDQAHTRPNRAEEEVRHRSPHGSSGVLGLHIHIGEDDQVRPSRESQHRAGAVRDISANEQHEHSEVSHSQQEHHDKGPWRGPA